jgi:hypothetical protein
LPDFPTRRFDRPKDDGVFQWLDDHRDEFRQWRPSAEGVDFSAKACKNGKPVRP